MPSQSPSAGAGSAPPQGTVPAESSVPQIDSCMKDLLATLWPPLLAALQLLMAAVASAHVVLHKRDVRAAIGWIGLIWLVPYGGSVLYVLFGINRIRRRASGLRAQRPQARSAARVPPSRDGSGERLAELRGPPDVRSPG